MPLAIGQTVFATASKRELTVKRLLGAGGQGDVYLVADQAGQFALKWYNDRQSTADQQQAIHTLVKSGPPRGAAGRRFVWPQDLVTAPSAGQFGYLMDLIETQRFASLDEVMARQKPAPGFDSMCEISYQMANSYRALHLSGYCYRDISQGNVMFDPRSGEVLICDNDNVGVNRHSKCLIQGTPGYMAPELIRGQADPSTEADLHSLAVLLFRLWHWHHPLHGLQEYNIRCWDIPAQTKIYGTSPVFIFDPHDNSNRLPNDHGYTSAGKSWKRCPAGLQELFLRAFTHGLHEPARRVTEGEWQSVFLQLKDGVLPCPACHAVNLWEPRLTQVHCWHCQKPIAIPTRLAVEQPAGRHFLLLTKSTRLLHRHIEPRCPDDQADEVWGEAASPPKQPTVAGLRNRSPSPWTVTLLDGSMKEIEIGKAVALAPGMKLNIRGIHVDVLGE